MSESAPLIIDDSTPRVRVIRLNRPSRLNALDGPSLEALVGAVAEASAAGRDIRAIIITGTGRGFCTGSDLKWMASGVLADTAAHLRNQDRMQRAYEMLEAAPQAVIAAVNGITVAGGFELMLACDIVLAAEEAEIGDAHIRRNLFPSGGSTQRLPRKVGPQRALHLLLTGRRLPAREAERMGLVTEVVPGTALMSHALALAAEIALADAQVIALMKSATRSAMHMPLHEGLAHERWLQHRYKSESPAMDASVHAFARGSD